MTDMGQDNCYKCEVLENPRFWDPESDDYFDCALCACYRCPHLHDCEGQCAQGGESDG